MPPLMKRFIGRVLPALLFNAFYLFLLTGANLGEGRARETAPYLLGIVLCIALVLFFIFETTHEDGCLTPSISIIASFVGLSSVVMFHALHYHELTAFLLSALVGVVMGIVLYGFIHFFSWVWKRAIQNIRSIIKYYTRS
jgi:hypothetical protein